MKQYTHTSAMLAGKITSVQQVGSVTVLQLEDGEQVEVPAIFVALHKPKVGLYFCRMQETGWQCCMTGKELARHYQQMDDRVQGTHGGTLVLAVENGSHTVAVRAMKDGKPVGQIQVLGLSADQARSVQLLASLWGAVQGPLELFDERVQQTAEAFRAQREQDGGA